MNLILFIEETFYPLFNGGFEKYLEENIMRTFIYNILTFVMTLIFFLIPQLRELILNNVIIFFFILGLFVVFFFLYINYWLKYNFVMINVKNEYLLILEGRDDNHITLTVPNCIIPSEDLLKYELKLNFDKLLKKELNNKKKYTLLFKKPVNLEVKNNSKIPCEVVKDGLNDIYCCFIFNFRNNDSESYFFEFQGESGIDGDLEVYFLKGEFKDGFSQILEKMSPLFIEKIFSSELGFDEEFITLEKK